MYKNTLIYKILRVIYYQLIYIKHRIKIVIDDHKWERELGIDTVDHVASEKIKNRFDDSTMYAPTPYHVLQCIFQHIHVNSFGESITKTFVDLGCGKGRVICMASLCYNKKVIGVEVDKYLYDVARDNVSRFYDKRPCKERRIEIVNQDVVDFDVTKGDVFFMCNPFGNETMKVLMENIKRTLPREINIITYGIKLKYDWLEEEVICPNVKIWTPKGRGKNEDT